MNFFKDHLNLSNNIYDNAKILKAAEINKQQEIVDRNPTTKYYQTLALNLQEQVQYLKRMLNEVNAPDGGLQMTDQEDYERGQIGRMQNDPPEPHPNQGRDPNIPRPFNPGNGVFPTFRCPVPNCTPGSPTWIEQFKYWVLAQDGRWHGWNDYPALSDEWWAWEIDKQINPPMRKNTPAGTPGTFNYGPPSPKQPQM
jgi:hypothetical protein